MRFQKRVVCFGMAALLLLAPSMKADAATHVTGCGATARRIVCTPTRVATPSEGQHLLYETANGSKVWCYKSSEVFLHNIHCANSSCNVLLEKNQARKCVIHHSVCPDETGCCQY